MAPGTRVDTTSEVGTLADKNDTTVRTQKGLGVGPGAGDRTGMDGERGPYDKGSGGPMTKKIRPVWVRSPRPETRDDVELRKGRTRGGVEGETRNRVKEDDVERRENGEWKSNH